MAKTKFELYKDKKGEFRWRLLAQNGEPVATGGEGFKEKRSAVNSIKKLKDWANTDIVIDIEKIKDDAILEKERAKKAEILAKEKAKKETAAKKNASSKTTKKVVKKTNKKPAVKKTETKTEEIETDSVM